MSLADQGRSAMFFDENARAGDWREQVLHCRDKGVSISRQVTFALAVADLCNCPTTCQLCPQSRPLYRYRLD